MRDPFLAPILLACASAISVGAVAECKPRGAPVTITAEPTSSGTAPCELDAILDAAGAYWGTACGALARRIGAAVTEAERGEGIPSPRPPCTSVEPIARPGAEPVAWVCPGARLVAQRVVGAAP